MPSIPTCKLCNLLEQDSDLWWGVHLRIFEEGFNHSALVTWLNGRVEIQNQLLPADKQLQVFNRTNIQNHFIRRVHVRDMAHALTIRDAARAQRTRNPYKNAPPDPEKSVEVVEEVGGAEAAMGADKHSHFTSDVSEFKRMRNLIAATESRLYSFNNQMVLKEEEAAKKGKVLKIDLHEVASFQKLVSELLKLQKEAAKVEASSKIAGAALLDALGLLVEGTLTRVDSASSEIHGILAREMPGSRLPDQVSALLRTRIGDVIKLAIPQIIDTIHKRYGIK